MFVGCLCILVCQLYWLFEEQGDSVCCYIFCQCFSCSVVDFGNLWLCGELIIFIVFKWGFSDLVYFSWVFKKQFEVLFKDYWVGVLLV